MTKKQFLAELAKALKRLPEEERQDILRDFEEHFELGLSEGKSEEEICQALGSPHQIGKELLVTYQIDKVEHQANAGNMIGAAGTILGAIWAAVGLSFFNFVILLGPFIALVAILVGGWIVGISFLISPLLVLVNAVFVPGSFLLARLFRSLVLAGVGLLIVLGMLYATRLVVNGFIRYLRFNVKLVKGGWKHD